MRLLFAVLLLAACSQPCIFACADDAECLPGKHCYQHVACLDNCYTCNGQCVPTHENCGACGNACAAGQVCQSGACAAACAATFTSCGTGSCYDLKADRFNCGGCGHVCAENEACSAGACAAVCD